MNKPSVYYMPTLDKLYVLFDNFLITENGYGILDEYDLNLIKRDFFYIGEF